MLKNFITHVYFWVGVNVIGLPNVIEHSAFEVTITLFQNGHTPVILNFWK